MKPKQYFDEIWQRCQSLRALHSYLSAQVTSALNLDEILRAEWAMRVSALDLYVHEIVAQNMMNIFEGQRTSNSNFGKFLISGDTMIRIRDASSVHDARAAFDLDIRSKLSRRTFQFPDDIADGIRLISEIQLWNEIAVYQGASRKDSAVAAKNLKRVLSSIVERRNKIVHEGDLEVAYPRVPRSIFASDLDDVEAHIGGIVVAIDNLI